MLPKLAEILGVSIEHLLDPSLQVPARKKGPVGKVRRTFEEVSQLPRREREKILDVVDAMLEQYRHRKAG